MKQYAMLNITNEKGLIAILKENPEHNSLAFDLNDEGKDIYTVVSKAGPKDHPTVLAVVDNAPAKNCLKNGGNLTAPPAEGSILVLGDYCRTWKAR